MIFRFGKIFGEYGEFTVELKVPGWLFLENMDLPPSPEWEKQFVYSWLVWQEIVCEFYYDSGIYHKF